MIELEFELSRMYLDDTIQWHIVTGQIDSIDWAFYVIYLRYKNLAIPQLVLGCLQRY